VSIYNEYDHNLELPVGRPEIPFSFIKNDVHESKSFTGGFNGDSTSSRGISGDE